MPRYCAILTVAFFLLCIPMACACAKIVISELLWSGSDLSTADEWIELSNTGSGNLSLSGYTITKLSKGDEVPMLTLNEYAMIGSGGTFLVANYSKEDSRLAIDPDFVTSAVSLSNTKLQLKLYNSSGGALLDVADDGIGVPFAGSNDEPKSSMERISLTESGALKTNWRTATTFLNFDDGAPLFGTPGAPNGTGTSVDVFPPAEATNFVAETAHYDAGTASTTTEPSLQFPPSLQITWTTSSSLDLAVQHLSWSGTGITLSATATGMTLANTGTGITFTLKSIDSNGNTSSGVTTISKTRPLVMITEALANPAGRDDEEWIEIANFGKEPVDLFGWVLDEGNSPGNYQINSSLVLEPNDYHVFPKSVTGLPLGNNGEMVSLMRGENVMDQWEYPKTAEEVSYGRKFDDPDSFAAFCVPTPGKPNEIVEPTPVIVIQSGNLEAEGKVTINLEASVMTGSTAHANCSWNYGDGFRSDSCNPPSHTFTNPGVYEIKLNYSDFCNNSIERTVTATVKESGRHTSSTSQTSTASTTSSPSPSSTNTNSDSACRPTHFGGVRISEFLANPVGSDTEGEWIELENVLNQNVSLCGWKIDDIEGGSKPFSLNGLRIAAKQFLILRRDETKLALNNSNEKIRLFAPGNDLKDEVFYAKSSEGESIALRSDGLFVSTPFLTPGNKNRFRTAERRFDHETVVVSAALPNPDGEDKGNEWIEVANVGDGTVNMRGWFLDNKKDSRSPYEIPNVILRPGEVRRFAYDKTNITLTNSSGQARLLDPDGAVVSVLGWKDAASGRIYRPAQPGKKVKARVTNVIDGDTIDVIIEGVRERVRLIGVDTPETVHPAKAVEYFGKEASNFTKQTLEGKEVTLEFGEEDRDKYERILAYVILNDGVNFNGKLIAYGYAYAYLRFPFVLSDLFAAYEAEARRAKLGLWADDEVVLVLRKEGVISDDSAETPNGEYPPEEDAEESQSSATGSTLSGSNVLTESGTSLRDLQSEESAAEDQSSTPSEPINLFSEILPNPPKEGHLHGLGEYIELYNPTDELISLTGLILDDDPNGSSKAKILGDDYVIEPHGYLLLCNGTGCDLPLKITLNNGGEELSLTASGGTVIDKLAYPKMKRGEVFALHPNRGWVLSVVATPREKNICRAVVAGDRDKENGKRDKEKEKMPSSPSPYPFSLKTKYRHIYNQILTSHDEQTELPPMLAILQHKFVGPSLPPKLAVSGTGASSPGRFAEIPVLASLSFLALAGTVFARQRLLLCHPE